MGIQDAISAAASSRDTQASASGAQSSSSSAESKITAVTNEDEKAIEANVTIATANQRRADGGQFWADFAKDPKAALQAKMNELFAGNPAMQSVANSLFDGMMSGNFNPEGAASIYANAFVPSSFSGPAVTSDTTSGYPTSSNGRTAGGKTANGPTNCSRNVLVGTVAGGLAMFKSSQVGQTMKDVLNAQQIVTSMGSVDEEFESLLVLLPSYNLSVFLNDKKALLDSLNTRIQMILGFIEETKEEDYNYDYKLWLLGIVDLLSSADSNLETIMNVLMKGGKFQKTLWEQADKDVKAAASAVDNAEETGVNLPINNKQMNIIGLLFLVNSITQVLLCRQRIIEDLYDRISNFPADYRDSRQPDNLFGTAIDQIRCLLKAVIGDMQAAMQRTQYTIMAKQEQWTVDLWVIVAFMSSVIGNIEPPNRPVNSVIELTSPMSRQAPTWNNRNDFTALVNLVEEFVRNARAGLFQPYANVPRIRVLAQTIEVEIRKQQEIIDELDKLVSKYAASFKDVATALAAINGLVEYLKSKNLTSMATAIANGDIKGFFKTLAGQATPEEEAMDSVTALIKDARRRAPSAVSELVWTYTELRGRARSNQELADLQSNTASDYVKEQKEQRTAKNNRMLQAIRRCNDKLKTAKERSARIDQRYAQINRKIAEVEGKIEAGQQEFETIVERITQSRPVSCGAKS